MPAAPSRARREPLPWLKPGLLVGGLVPFTSLAARALTERLGANPIATALNQLGLVALVFLVASLACTPLKALFGWTWPLRVRRMLGLFAFGYACAHLLLYAVVDQGLDLSTLVQDLAKRPFILVGFAAWLAMVPLAITSTQSMVKRLGFVAWQRLHRLAYAAGILGALHFVLRVKKDLTEPLVYASLLGALFFVRLAHWGVKRWKRTWTAVPTARSPASPR